jgi:asparagine synthase (glutamine-hydrolysing)
MCGICGLAGRDPLAPPLEEPVLRAMTDAIVHRGPDEEGLFLGPGVALGMRRLSIIDVAGSHQPVCNETRSVRAVFNGEIYNFRELRAELERRGHRLRTDGDGETIVHLYEELGTRFVERLSGMFAIALWDSVNRRLVLARDRMGVKPLYYAIGPAGLAFASELKALLAGGLVDRELDPVGAELFLAHGFVPGPHTLLRGVKKLMPASVAVWENGTLTTEDYWTPWDEPVAEAGHNWEEDQERLLELIRGATRARMVSDVPLGVMLSGGLDSSLITALMAEASSRPVKTFSIGFAEEADANELADARAVAQRLGTDHHELTTSAIDHPDLLEETLWHLEEPIADVSAIGMLLLSRLARQSVTVALSGQGADELLAGYRKHDVAFAASLLSRLPVPVRPLARVGGRSAPAGSTVARGLTAIGTSDPATRLLAMSRVVQPHERVQLLARPFGVPDAEHEIIQVVRNHLPGIAKAAAAGRRLSPLGETLYLDTRLALVDNMLLYFDKTSMATSLEVRVPFMDREVVSFCMSLPDSRRIWRLRRKELLRRASRGLVDESIIGKKKRGFFHPALAAWLQVHRDALVHETLLGERAAGRGQYRPEAVRELVRAAGEGGKKPAQRLFSLLLLEKWQQLFLDADGPAAALASRGGSGALAA